MRQNAETPDPPALLGPGFTIARWEAGRLAAYEADENAAGGRPYLDRVEILLGRTLRDQASDLDLGKADIVELGPNELRRQPSGRRVWSSSPVRVLALVFSPASTMLACAKPCRWPWIALPFTPYSCSGRVRSPARYCPSGSPATLSCFPRAADLGRARQLAAGARPITLGFIDAAARPIAERIALNARDAGLSVSVTPQAANADVTLMELRIASPDPAKALAEIGAALGLPAPARDPSANSSPEQNYATERAWLDSFRVIPLIHLPDVYGVGPRVRGRPGITPTGEFRFDNLWLEGARP